MCKDKSALLLAAISNGAEARKGKGKAKVRKQKQSSWTGVRFQYSGKWAMEIRMPRTREKVWIGTFTTARQAALAYDATVFCFFGECVPKTRKINFPTAPRPEISESERLQLSVADVKVIAEKHARHVDALLPPLADMDNTDAPNDQLVVASALPPVAVDAPPTGAGGPAPPDSPDLDQMISDFDIDAFNAELDAVTFLVSDDEYYA